MVICQIMKFFFLKSFSIAYSSYSTRNTPTINYCDTGRMNEPKSVVGNYLTSAVDGRLVK